MPEGAKVKIVVIGGGFAGLAAAIALQERRHEVLLLERRGVLGGRATSFPDALSGEQVDNGTHLMVGAYAETLDLVRRAGAADCLLEQENLRLDYLDERGPTSLDCPPLPAPLHLLFGLLSLRVPWSVRWQALRLGLAVRFGRPPADQTLAEYLRRCGQGPQARLLLWDGLATAILNETPERAAATCSTTSTARPSWARVAPRAWSSCAAAGGSCASGWGATSRAAAAACTGARACWASRWRRAGRWPCAGCRGPSRARGSRPASGPWSDAARPTPWWRPSPGTRCRSCSRRSGAGRRPSRGCRVSGPRRSSRSSCGSTGPWWIG